MVEVYEVALMRCLGLGYAAAEDFVTALFVQKDPVNFKEAITDPCWCITIDAKLKVLKENGNWELTSLHARKKAIGCHWIFKTKLMADGMRKERKLDWLYMADIGTHLLDHENYRRASIVKHLLRYGYIKNHMKTVKSKQARTREWKSGQNPEAKPGKVKPSVKKWSTWSTKVNS
ncbi:hypothetical protein Tco_0606768 [Tanacetum coccineum]